MASLPSLKLPMLPLLMLVAVALTPLNTKIAALAWLLGLLWALSSWLKDPCQRIPTHTPSTQAARCWVIGALIFTAINTLMAWAWYGPCCQANADLNSTWRLALGALASLALVKHLKPWPHMGQHINIALVCACVACFVLPLIVGRRLPSNAVPWATAMAFFVCLLLPHACSSTPGQTLHQTPRWLYPCAIALGIGGILLSQSRGAYAIVIWALFIIAIHRLKNQPWKFKKIIFSIFIILLTGIGAAIAPQDPLRIREAIQDTRHALQTHDYNSSLGARIYLTQFAWNKFTESPWVGIGSAERLKSIQLTGLDIPDKPSATHVQIRHLRHVHNQYLHYAVDNGIIGLAGFLISLLAMGVAAWRLRLTHKIHAMQIAGITFMHAISSISNVNLAHNYYALVLSITLGLALLQSTPQNTPTP